MSFTIVAATLFALQAAPEAGKEEDKQAVAEAVETTQTEPNIDVVEKKPEKITDKSHPDYVRCKSESIIGSRAKRKRTCLTNREWTRLQRRGNEASRDFVQDMQSGSMGNN